VLGELQGDSIRYRAFNACILLLATLDGKQLITVEDLASDGLHPVQQALVDHHGSQCGFCTPGFVMSLFAMVHEEGRDKGCKPGGVGRAVIDESLAGNLCRCTGYAPIVQAAEDVLAEPVNDRFSANREQTVSALSCIWNTRAAGFIRRDRLMNCVSYSPGIRMQSCLPAVRMSGSGSPSNCGL